MFNFQKTMVSIGLAFLIGACSSSVKINDDSVATANAGGGYTYDPISDPKTSVYGMRSIYYEFDSYTVDPKYATTIAAHAGYLKSKKSNVIIQGNTDDRGTAEYNLALGQKRSDAVRKSLLAQGVSDSKIEAVSFGKEKPADPAQTEAAYKQNRRADFIYR